MRLAKDGRCAPVFTLMGRSVWTKYVAPAESWNQLNPSGNHQIGGQEALAVVMDIWTFDDKVSRSALSRYLGNGGAMHGLAKGSSRAAATHTMIGKV